MSTDDLNDVLFRLQRGLAGYVSYLAACEMNQSFSEYILYEPILRIMTARGYVVHCEVECRGLSRSGKGDQKRLDFVAKRATLEVALEVKWVRGRKPRLDNDKEKLVAYVGRPTSGVDARGVLCLFGRKSHLSKAKDPEGFKEILRPVYAEFGRTRYGCRIFQLHSTAASISQRGAR